MKLSAQAVALALVAGSIAASADAGAKDGSGVPRVGFLTSGSETTLRTRVEALKRGLGELGYVEGQTIALEYRYADAKPERLLAIARELVGLKVAVIVAHGTPASLAVKQTTSALPIVILEVGDPVGARLASTLARPGGNVTGVAQIGVDLYGKQFEVLKEIFPKMSKVAPMRGDRSFHTTPASAPWKSTAGISCGKNGFSGTRPASALSSWRSKRRPRFTDRRLRVKVSCT